MVNLQEINDGYAANTILRPSAKRSELEMIDNIFGDFAMVRENDPFLYTGGEGDHRLIAIVIACIDAHRGSTSVLCEISEILHKGEKVEHKNGDQLLCGPLELTWMEKLHHNPVEPGCFVANLSHESYISYPTPALLGQELLRSLGYLFAGTPETNMYNKIQVPIYNLRSLVGFVSYVETGGTVSVTVSDVPNPQGNILTTAAKLQF